MNDLTNVLNDKDGFHYWANNLKQQIVWAKFTLPSNMFNTLFWAKLYYTHHLGTIYTDRLYLYLYVFPPIFSTLG